MANVQRRTHKDGSCSYRIRVSNGFSADGRRLFKTTTYTPAAGTTLRGAEKEAARRADAFEQQVQQGIAVNTTMTVDELIALWFEKYAAVQLKPSTITGYRSLVPRVSAALGNLKAAKVRPAHLLAFYENLRENGVRQDSTYTILPQLADKLPRGTRQEFAKRAGVSSNTVLIALRGDKVSQETAHRMAAAAGIPFTKAFKEHRRAEKLKGNTVLHYHTFLSSVFEKAVRWQMLPENPCARVDPPRAGEIETQFLDEKGVAGLLDALPDAPVQYSTLVQMALLTGCRRGELCGLRWADINFAAATLSIERGVDSVPGHGQVFVTPKTKRSRRCIKLSTDAVQLLQDYRRWQTAEKIKVGSQWVRQVEIFGEKVENDLLFTRWNGLPFDPEVITTWFPRFLRAHNLPGVRFHSLRHTNASLLIAAHVPVTTVSGRLGHSRTSTTTDIYAACIRTSDAAAADALESVFTRIRQQNIG
jgi:integrase